MSERFLVTSWDDGDRRDMRLADLLDDVGVRGTFYLSRSTCSLATADIVELAERHEVASHTLNHTLWGEASPQEWLEDVLDGRSWLEDLLGHSVAGFAYPAGRHSLTAADLIRPHLDHARTTLLGATSRGNDPMVMHTTAHARPFSLRHRVSGLRTRWTRRRSWSLAQWPDQVGAADRRGGSVIHLWGHSWELDETESWEILRASLATALAGRVPLTVSDWLRAPA